MSESTPRGLPDPPYDARVNLGWEEILVLMVAFAGVTGLIARSKGHRVAGWAFLAFWFGPIALAAILLLPNKSSPQHDVAALSL
jgi:hypothetical protein